MGRRRNNDSLICHDLSTLQLYILWILFFDISSMILHRLITFPCVLHGVLATAGALRLHLVQRLPLTILLGMETVYPFIASSDAWILSSVTSDCRTVLLCLLWGPIEPFMFGIYDTQTCSIIPVSHNPAEPR